MQIAIINQSTKVSDADIATMTEACSFQLTNHVAPPWGMTPVPVVFYQKGAILPGDARPIAIIDQPDTDGALGYHTEDGGKIWGRVFVNPVLTASGVVLCDPANIQNTSVASVLSHEVIEMFIDPFINSWCDGPQLPQGQCYALEACDPVEADSYVVQVQTKAGPVNVAVSNFILPAWFDVQSQQKNGYDYLNKLTAPFTMTQGGYLELRSAPGAEQQIFGEKYPDWRKDTKAHSLSRTSQRSTR